MPVLKGLYTDEGSLPEIAQYGPYYLSLNVLLLPKDQTFIFCLICGSDKRSEKQALSPDSDISIETERALLLEVPQQTDTDSDDNSFDISEVI